MEIIGEYLSLNTDTAIFAFFRYHYSESICGDYSKRPASRQEASKAIEKACIREIFNKQSNRSRPSGLPVSLPVC